MVSMMSIMLSLSSFQVLGKLDLVVLEFWLFIELSILDKFLTWFIKHAIIPVSTYFHIPIDL